MEMAYSHECFFCGNLSSDKVFRSMIRLNQAVLVLWKRKLAVTLCNLLDLDLQTHQPIFEKARFCNKCLENVLAADFAIKSISRFQAQLGTLRNDIQALLALNCENVIQRGESDGFADYQDDSIGNIINTIHLTVSANNAHSIQINHHSDAIYEDPDPESPEPEVKREAMESLIVDQRFTKLRRKRKPAEDHLTEMRDKLREKKKRHEGLQDRKHSIALPSSSTTNQDKVIYSRSGRRLKPVLNLTEDHMSNDEPEHENSKNQNCGQAENSVPCTRVKGLKRRGKSKPVKNAKEFQCTICKLPFPSTSLLDKHLAQTHKLNYDHNCQICLKGFEDVETVKEHEELHSSAAAPFTCVLCTVNFSDGSRLIRHVKSIHEGKTLWCNFSSCLQNFVVFRCVKDMGTHLAGEHGIEGEVAEGSLYHCTECQSRYSQLQYLHSHERKHKEKPTVPCTFCDKLFYTTQRMKRHLGNIHTAIQMKPKCLICEKRFESPEDKDAHESLHSNETPFYCVICETRLSTSADLRRHVQRVHEILPFKCEVEACGLSYDTSWKLKRHHSLTHCREKTYKCPQCPFRSPGQASLKTHVLSHTKEEGYPCPICGCERRFVYKQALDKHVLHFHKTGDKKTLQCKVCGKRFRDGTKLKQHEVYHADLRSFMCELCSATFKTKKDLLGHAKLHDKQNQIRDPTPRKSRLLRNLKVGGDEMGTTLEGINSEKDIVEPNRQDICEEIFGC